MRVSDLDAELMVRLGARLRAELPSTTVVVLTDGKLAIPSELAVSSTKLVELRNPHADGSLRQPLLVFVPSEVRASAEDSFGVATFEEVSVTGLYEALITRLIEEIPPALRGSVQESIRRLREAEKPWAFADALSTCLLYTSRSFYDELPRDVSGKVSAHRAEVHRRFIAMARRRAFFERRDNGWRSMLPYKTAEDLLAVVRGDHRPEGLLEPLLVAINRGEGLTRPERIGNNLALEVRRVDGGSVRSYRLYPRERFSLSLADQAARSRFVEHMPTGLVLRYQDKNLEAELLVSLDVYEMLQRLNEGYRPSVEEEQGYYLSLAVFKNQLGSAPYQEVLLSTSGHDFYRVARQADGRLEMTRAREPSALGREGAV